MMILIRKLRLIRRCVRQLPLHSRAKRLAIHGILLMSITLSFLTVVKYNFLMRENDDSVLRSLYENDVNFLNQFKLCSSDALQPRRPLPSEVRRRGEWQVYAGNDSLNAELVTYSTFYDDRPVLGTKRYLRTMAVASYPVVNSSYFCQVWYSHLSLPFIVEAEALQVGRQYGINKAKYKQLLLSCQLPSNDTGCPSCTNVAPPTHVSMTTAPCSQSSILMPVIVSKAPRDFSKLPVGICVAIAFGSIDANELVEWFEINRILGVNEFNVYNGSLTSQLDYVFRYYERQGVLNVHQMEPPVVDAKKGVTYDTVKVSSPASLNDCMLRNMYRYRLAIVIDFDEVIIPRKHDNYSSMLEAIEEKSTVSQKSSGVQLRHHTYTFRNAYFLRQFSAVQTTNNSRSTSSTKSSDRLQPGSPPTRTLFTSTHVYRAPVSGIGFGPKSFVDPRRCLSVFNHYCYIRFRQDPLSEGKATGDEGVMGGPVSNIFYDVPTEIGVSHHYRRVCNGNKKTCSEYAAKRQLDQSALRFESRLRDGVERVFGEIGSLSEKVER